MVPMPDAGIDDKSSDTLVVVFGRRFWTGSSTLPHLHHEFHGGRGACARAASGAVGTDRHHRDQPIFVGRHELVAHLHRLPLVRHERLDAARFQGWV